MARRSRGVRRVVSFARLARVCAARELVARLRRRARTRPALARHHHPHTAPAPMAPFFRRGVPSAPPPLRDAARTGTPAPALSATAPPRQLRLEVDDSSCCDSHPLDVPAPARPRVPVPSFPPTRAVSPEWTKFRAVVAKNWTLRTRGAALWCSLLELVVPLAFIALMGLPRLLIADEDRAATVHRPARLDALSSGRLPADGSGAYASSRATARARGGARLSSSRGPEEPRSVRRATYRGDTLRRTRSPNFRTVSTLRISPSVRVRSRARFGTRTRASCSARRSRRRW